MFKKIAQSLIAVSFLLASQAYAAIQQHNFTVTGTGGVTGTGSFTWDDTVQANGSNIVGAPTNVLTITINLTGGVAGAGQAYTKANCTQVNLRFFPTFATDLNFWCDNGTLAFTGTAPYTGNAGAGASTLTWAPGATVPFVAAAPASVPTLSQWSMMVLVGLMALFGIRQNRRRSN